MLPILIAILPVFALIGAGAAFGRCRKLGPQEIAVLNGFTVWLALPTLLFRSMAEGDQAAVNQPGFVDRQWAAAAILIAGLPTGTGPFMLAERYGRDVALASRANLLWAAASVISIAGLAYLLLPAT